jgi:hypothetical protein
MTAADSAIESSVQWAVCPRIDISDLNQRPEYFPSKEEAELRLDFPLFGPSYGVDGRRQYTTSGREIGSVALPVVERTKVPRGPTAKLTLSQFFERGGKPSGSYAKLDDRLYDQARTALSRKGPLITCCLAADWDFGAIEDDACALDGQQQRWTVGNRSPHRALRCTS